MVRRGDRPAMGLDPRRLFPAGGPGAVLAIQPPRARRPPAVLCPARGGRLADRPGLARSPDVVSLRADGPDRRDLRVDVSVPIEASWPAGGRGGRLVDGAGP